ncbi:MAG: GNAT family N-acetyltransferase, partial [Lentilitoribacter sp.]
MDIRIDDLSGPEVKRILTEHLEDMYASSPAECVFALDLDALKQPSITFWSVWQDKQLLGCGALKALSTEQGEIKSMRTTQAARNKGVASSLLQHII